MAEPPANPKPRSKPRRSSRTPPIPEPLVDQVAKWIPLLAKIVGLAGFAYELVFVHPPSAVGVSAAVGLAIGGKAIDSILKGGL